MEWVAGCSWNPWPDHRGARTRGSGGQKCPPYLSNGVEDLYAETHTGAVGNLVSLFMALLSSVASTPRAYRLKVSNAALSEFQQ